MWTEKVRRPSLCKGFKKGLLLLPDNAVKSTKDTRVEWMRNLAHYTLFIMMMSGLLSRYFPFLALP